MEEEERTRSKKFAIIILIAFLLTAVLIVAFSLSLGGEEGIGDEDNGTLLIFN